MMKNASFALMIVGLFFFSSCSKPEVNNSTTGNDHTATHDSHDPQAASTQPKDGLYPGKGKITKINNELGSVELDHEEIVGVMPPMIMEFYVHEKWLLTGLKVGEDVEFVLKYEHPAETIVSIKKIK